MPTDDSAADADSSGKAADSSAACPLLELCAELRNRIYEYALVEDSGRVYIDKDHFQQPALLRTCRQIRGEAIAIYYLNQEFNFNIHDYDASMLIKFCKQADWLPISGLFDEETPARFHFTMDLYGSKGWCNLLVWLEAYHKEEVAGMGVKREQAGTPGFSASTAFDLVHELRDMPWERVKMVLEIHKEASRRVTNLQWEWE